MIALFVATMLFVSVPAQGSGDAEKPAQTSKAERLKHWRSLDAEARGELSRRYEKLKTLSPEERAKLVERGKRLEQEIGVTLRSLSPKERAAIEALDPVERRRVLRGMVGDRARRAAAQLRSRLTDEQRAALEAASPEERATILHDVRRREESRMSERMSTLGRDLGFSEGEMRRIERGSPAERRKVMVEVVRKRANRYVDTYGLPPGVTREQWRKLVGRSDEEFVRSYLRIRARHPEFGVPPKQWEQRQKRGASLASRLESFSRPTARQRAAAPRLKEAQLRRRVLLERRREVEEALVRVGHLSREEGARLRKLDDDGFVRMYRRTVMTLRRGGDPRSGFERGTKKAPQERAGRGKDEARRRHPGRKDG